MVAQLPSAAHSATGRPPYQHDRHLIHHTSSAALYAVADGHGSERHGHTVAHHIVASLPHLFRRHNIFTPSADLPARLRTAISSLEASAIAATSAARVYAGSTLCAVLHSGSSIVCANVGDSRALVIPAVGHPRQLSTDHVCTHPVERDRIEKAGGVVIGGLLNGYISMSRAIGDDDLKAHRNITPFPFSNRNKFTSDLFIADPDVTQYRVRDSDVVTIVASDGVWGKLSNTDVAAVVRSEILKGRVAAEIAKAVVKKAISRGSRDNVTAVVAFLKEEASVRMLVAEKRRRKNRTGPSPPKRVVDIVNDTSTEYGSDTATSSDGGVAVSADSVLKERRGHGDGRLRRHRNPEDKRGSRLRRFKFGQRNLTTMN